MKARIVLKRVLYSLLAWASVFRRRRRAPPHREQLKNVLVVQLGLMGDVLLVTPMLQLMRATLPKGSRITLVVPPASRAAVENNPHVDLVITYDAFWADPAHNHRHTLGMRHLLESWRFIRCHRRVTYDLIINCWMMDQPLTPLMLSFLKSHCVLGFDFQYCRAYSDRTYPLDPNRHIADSLIDLYQGIDGVVAAATRPMLHYRLPADGGERDFDEVLGQIKGPYLVISPFCSERAKEWDLAHWATVLNDVNRRYPHASLVLTGLANARQRGELLAALVDGGIHNTVGELTLPRFARLVRHAAAVLTTDSGSVHLASAFGVPVFVLFSQIYNYRQFLPYQVANDYSVVPVSCAGCIYGCAAVTCMKHDVSKVRDQIHRFCQGIPSLSA